MCAFLRVPTWGPGGRGCWRSSELLWWDPADTPAVCGAASPYWSHCSPPSGGSQHTATCKCANTWMRESFTFHICDLLVCDAFRLRHVWFACVHVCTCSVCPQWRLRLGVRAASPTPPGSLCAARRWPGTKHGAWGGRQRGMTLDRLAPLEPAAIPAEHLCNLQEVKRMNGHIYISGTHPFFY